MNDTCRSSVWDNLILLLTVGTRLGQEVTTAAFGGVGHRYLHLLALRVSEACNV